MANEKKAVAVPGERLGSLEEYLPGKGTYIRHGYLYSSLVGFKHVEKNENKVWFILIFRILYHLTTSCNDAAVK